MRDELRQRDIENAQTISNMINDFGFSPRRCAEAMAREHRTLQQTFTSLCIEWLNVCASEDYRYDGRNELSHKVAKDLMDGKDYGRLPMI